MRETIEEAMKKVPAQWLEYFDEAVELLNSRIIKSLGYSPHKLLFGMALMEQLKDLSEGAGRATETATEIHLAFVNTLRSDGFTHTIDHATICKKYFIKKVKLMAFQIDDLVQVYNNKLDQSFSTQNKLARRWSAPMKIISCHLNSYTLHLLGMLEGGIFMHSRRMRHFIPNPGSTLSTLTKSRQNG